MNDSDFLSLAWTQLVQVSVLIALVWLLVKLFARKRPHLAHALWLLVLVKCATPPLIGSSTGLFARLSIPAPSWLVAEPDVRQELPETALTVRNSEPETGNPVSNARIEIDDFSRGVVIDDEDFFEERFRAGTPAVEEVRIPDEPIAASASFWIVWFGSAGVVLFLTLSRVLIALRRVSRHKIETPAELESQVAELSLRLNLRRKIKILVTAARVGPAVVGWFRPLLILPDVIVFDRRANSGDALMSPQLTLGSLEPILAHELLHVKRGDLGIGWLQVVVQSLWWFHPLVWLVNRFLSREAERCCDEAVVAELRCSPATYARCLLKVLEQKRNLTPIPACPGVKPVELTKQRMERIMQLGQGCRKRSPWWCWAILVLLGLVVLPGRSPGEADEPREELTPLAAEPEAETDEKPLEEVERWLLGTPSKNASRVETAHDEQNDPQLQQILDQWEHNSRERKRVTASLRRFLYDLKSETEYHSDIELIYAEPDQYRIAEFPANVFLDNKENRKNQNGEPFLLRAVTPTIWINNGKQVARIQSDGMTIHDAHAPVKGNRIFDNIGHPIFDNMPFTFPLKHLVGPAVKEARELYQFALLPNPNDKFVWIGVQPKQAQDRSVWQRAVITLDRKMFFPREIKVIGATGRHEVVYVFHKLEVNGTFKSDPFDISRVSEKDLISSITPRVRSSQISSGTFEQIEIVQLRIIGPQQSQLTIHVADRQQTRHQLALPGRQNLAAGQIYSLTLEQGLDREKTRDQAESHWMLEIPEIIPRSGAYLIHNSIPLALTDEDLTQVTANNSVTKVVYLPHPSKEEELALAGVETLVSTRLDPGLGAVEEAKKRGTIIAVLRSQPAETESAERGEPMPLVLKVYPVADLIVPNMNVEFPLSGPSPPAAGKTPTALSPNSNEKTTLEAVTPAPWLPIQEQESSQASTPPEPSPKIQTAMAQNLNSLADLIKESVPVENGWNQNDREAVLVSTTTLSLVVRATNTTHNEVSDLLRALRRMLDFQVTLECLTVQFANNSFQKFWDDGGVAMTKNLDATVQNTMTPLLFHNVDRTGFKAKVDQFQEAKSVSSPKITMFNGLGAELQISHSIEVERTVENLNYMIVPTISEDRRTIVLKLAVNPNSPLDLLSKAKSLTIRDGDSVLVEITDEVLPPVNVSGTQEVEKALRELKKRELGVRTFVLLTPRIIIQEEREELLGLPE